MAADPPLGNLVLSAASVTDDLGYVALADLAKAMAGAMSDYRIIGGHMIGVLAARWMLGSDLYRETGDADLGVTPVLACSLRLPDKLKSLGYKQVAGNRFVRTVSDIPVTVASVVNAPRRAVIDVLVPAYTSRAHQNVRVSEDLVTLAGVGPKDFSRSGRDEAAAVIRDLFKRRNGAGMAALEQELGLSRQAADQRYTRIRAMVERVLGVN